MFNTLTTRSRTLAHTLLSASVLCAAVVPTAAAQSTPVEAQSPGPQAKPAVRNTAQWNVNKARLAIDGYDPVSYFAGEKAVPLKGKNNITFTHGDVTYHFANQANLDKFKASPASYEPAYGGWCAWAMKEGDKVEVDPTSYLVQDGRLLLFYDGFIADTRKKWTKLSGPAQAREADAQWQKLTGETRPAPALKDDLAKTRADLTRSMPPATIETFDRAQAALAASGITDKALKVGQTAPMFTAPVAGGSTFDLASALKRGPAVITFYRGTWCPYCNVQLRSYAKMMPELQEMNATLVAISPQVNSEAQAEPKPPFTVATDSGNAIASTFGLTYTLDPTVSSRLGKLLEQSNGDTSNQLPITATYVIDMSGKITYAFVDTDYTTRAEPADILAAVKLASAK
jgi:peroxiredoxin